MPLFRKHILTWLSAAPLLALAACSGGKGDDLPVAVIGSATSGFEYGAKPALGAQMLRAATAEGLVGFDEEGRVIPALAERWIITDDGLSYIFRLRNGNWLDGSQLTATSVRSALNSAIAAQRGKPIGIDLAGVDDVRIMAGRVIELRLAAPNPDLLQLLAQPELALLKGEAGSGPMAATRNGEAMHLTAIAPEDRGLPEQEGWAKGVRPLSLTSLGAEQAVARFRDGDFDIVTGGTFRDFPLTGSLGFARGSLQTDPAIGLFGLVVVHGNGFLSSAANREILAMAIDRNALADALGVSGWTLTTRVVGPGMDGDVGAVGERWGDLSVADRQARAMLRVGGLGAAQPAPLRIAMPAGPGADIVFDRLSQDFAAVGLKAVRVASEADADLRLIDLVARYPRAGWFLSELSCAAQRGLCSGAADALAQQAWASRDRDQRSALFSQAEAELTAANVYIPIGSPLRWSLMRGGIKGYAANRFAVHPLMPMALVPR